MLDDRKSRRSFAPHVPHSRSRHRALGGVRNVGLCCLAGILFFKVCESGTSDFAAGLWLLCFNYVRRGSGTFAGSRRRHCEHNEDAMNSQVEVYLPSMRGTAVTVGNRTHVLLVQKWRPRWWSEHLKPVVETPTLGSGLIGLIEFKENARTAR